MKIEFFLMFFVFFFCSSVFAFDDFMNPYPSSPVTPEEQMVNEAMQNSHHIDNLLEQNAYRESDRLMREAGQHAQNTDMMINKVRRWYKAPGQLVIIYKDKNGKTRAGIANTDTTDIIGLDDRAR